MSLLSGTNWSMSDELHFAVNNLPEPTEARFRVRSLLVAMAVVAVAAALFGPIVRQLKPAAQTRVLFAWGIWLLAAVTWLGILARKRRDAERLAGATLLQLPMFDERNPLANPLQQRFKLLGLGLAATILMFSFTMAIADGSSGLPFLQVAILYACIAIGGIWCVVRIVLRLWWRKNVRFCKHGLLWDRSFLRWDHVVDTEWYTHDSAVSKVSLQAKGIDQQNVDTTLNVRVSPGQHEMVQLILDLNVVERPAVEFKRPNTELGTIPLSAAIRDPRFPKYVATFVLSLVIMFAAMHFFTARVTGIREFDQSVFLGIFLGTFVMSWRWRHAGITAGAPLVRLSARRSWPEIAAFAAAAAILFAVGSNLGWSNPSIAYVAGIGVGWTASSAIRGIFWGQIDLRENGVFFQGHCWPWSQVHVTLRHAEKNSRLVLARGWRQIVAAVPAEMRNVVEALLKEKFTNSNFLVATYR
jgi:hypothetical protein